MALAFAFAQPANDRRRPVDLEELVVWACRDQQALRDGCALHIVEAAAQFGIRNQRRHLTGSDYPGAWGVDSCARLAAIGAIGTRLDGGGPTRGIAPRMAADAEAVAAAIETLPLGQRRLVRTHGAAGTRPDWLSLRQPLVACQRPSDRPGRYRHMVEEEWRPTPLRSELAARYLALGQSLFDSHGRRRIVEEERGFSFRSTDDGKRELLVRWCPLEPEHSDAEIIEVNCDYAEWHDGLTALLKSVRSLNLRDHRVTGFAAPARPWENIPCKKVIPLTE